MNFIKSLLNKKINYTNFLDDINFDESNFSLSINKDPYKNSTLNRIITVEGNTTRSLISILDNEKTFLINETPRDMNINEFNFLIDEILKNIIEIAIKNNTLIPLVESNHENENKGLEWLKVSFTVLKKALNEIPKNPDYIFQGRIFWRNGEYKSLRIQCLSLDILLEFHEDHRLRVRVWNYKDGVKSSKDKEDFIADFAHLKGPVMDEIIHLFSEIRPYCLINS